MKVIGAGFGRTGTASLKRALELLGFNPCYHMEEVFSHREHIPTWEAATRGEPVDWGPFFQGWEATVDWPGCTFYKEILAAYPEAKVLLSVRDPDRWYDSCINTIYAITHTFPLRLVGPLLPGIGGALDMPRQLVFERTFGGRFADKAHALSVWHAHIDDVKATIPAEKLLVFDVKQGWEPLCRFLEVPVPDQPFPHVNDTAEFQGRIRSMNAMSWAILLTPVALLVGVLAWAL